jgi:tRNA threonylcarbamoyladenosine dehydratase
MRLILLVQLQTVPNFRIRTIPVLGTIPAIFGMAAATWLLCCLARVSIFPDPPFHIRRPQYETIFEALQEAEAARTGSCDGVRVDLEEVCIAR